MKFLKSLLRDFNLITGNDDGVWNFAIPAGMALLGAVQGEEKAAEARRMNKAAATQTQFSPWTKMGQGQLQSEGSGALGGAVQGGLTGASIMQNYNAANAALKGADTASQVQQGAQGAQAMQQAPAAQQAAFNQVPMQAAQGGQQNIADSLVASPENRNAFGSSWFDQQPQKRSWGPISNNMLYASN